MKVILFYHSLISDWNHGNAHFLRGVASEMIARDHEVLVYEPAEAWSRINLVRDHGEGTVEEFNRMYPNLHSIFYDENELDLDEALEDADLVIVHEWNTHSLVRKIGEHRATHSRYRLLFHDTHHRIATDFESMKQYDLRHYDGVLAFGEVISELYRSRGLTERAWTWHEAADTRIFKPIETADKEGDVVWIGNWGDHERTEELNEFLIHPVQELKLKTSIHGVRYPEEAKVSLQKAGIEYHGWIANYRAPERFAKHRLTVHIPRRPYVKTLLGIPTIRVFEALACGIPLISAPWNDSEGLFRPGDFWVARSGEDMKKKLQVLIHERGAAKELSHRGLETIKARHTCAHRVDELLSVVQQIKGEV